jgi:hypothetical protein
MTVKEAERHRAGYIQGKMRLYMPSEVRSVLRLLPATSDVFDDTQIQMAGLLTDTPLPPTVDMPVGPMRGSPLGTKAVFQSVESHDDAATVSAPAPQQGQGAEGQQPEQHVPGSSRAQSVRPAGELRPAVPGSAPAAEPAASPAAAGKHHSGATPVSSRFRVFRSFPPELLASLQHVDQ